DVEAAVNAAARSRFAYLISGNASELENYHVASVKALEQFAKLKTFTQDNPVQQSKCEQFGVSLRERLQAWDEAVSAKQLGHTVDLAQVLSQNVDLAAKSAAVADDVRNEESRLLIQRTQIAHRRFLIASCAVILSFTFALLLLTLYYR